MKKCLFCFIFLILIIKVEAHEVTVASNYIWRGVTQTNDGPAVQGSLSTSLWDSNNLSLWTSSLSDNGQEIDLTFSQSFDLSELNFEVGGVYYYYTTLEDSNYSELFLRMGWKILRLEYYQALDSQLAYYANFQLTHQLRNQYEAGIGVGRSEYKKTFPDNSYYDVILLVKKSLKVAHSFPMTVTFSWSKAWVGLNKDNVVVSSSWEF